MLNGKWGKSIDTPHTKSWSYPPINQDVSFCWEIISHVSLKSSRIDRDTIKQLRLVLNKASTKLTGEKRLGY